ncbi:hypothetical protein Tco_0738095 [Tanacetum coccineum]
MAAPGGNELARRVVDDLIEFSGQTSMDGGDVRVENAKLMGLNELVTQAEEEIEMKEAQLEVDYCVWCLHFEELDAYVTAGSLVKVMCSWYCAIVGLMCQSPYLHSDIKNGDRISLSKKRRLVAELEAVGEVEGVVKCLEHMRVIVARDAVTLGQLETLLGRAQVGVSFKSGFVADMEVKD